MRLFVAVWPSRFVIDALKRMRRPEIQGVRWTTEDQWHVTVRFLGEVDDPEPVGDALVAGLAGVSRAEVRVDRRSRRYGASAIGVPVRGLEAVAAAVATATEQWGRVETRPFRGHVTLARGKGRVPAAVLAVGLPALSWTAGEISLVRSHLGPKGARYETLQVIELA